MTRREFIQQYILNVANTNIAPGRNDVIIASDIYSRIEDICKVMEKKDNV